MYLWNSSLSFCNQDAKLIFQDDSETIPLHTRDDPQDLIRYPVRGRGRAKLVVPFARRFMDGVDKTNCFPPISACNQKPARVKTHFVAKLLLFIGNKSRRTKEALAYRVKRKDLPPDERLGPSGLRGKAKAKSAAAQAAYPWRHNRT